MHVRRIMPSVHGTTHGCFIGPLTVKGPHMYYKNKNYVDSTHVCSLARTCEIGPVILAFFMLEKPLACLEFLMLHC